MALDLSKLNFFSRLDARARVLVLFGAVIGLIFLVYFGTRYFAGGSSTTGPSRVANAPQGLQSTPGSKQLTPEYYRALAQANAQSAQQAQISGGSAINTMINVGGQGGQSCIVCSDQSANVRTFLDDWVRQGKVSPEVASALEQLADKNVPVSEYAAELDRLVKEGKLTPEQARMLLEQYKKQHANAMLNDSAKTMDALIKSGQLPIDVANQLLDAQKKGMSPAEYAAELQKLVKEGKISPEVAQQLLAQYTAQRAKEITQRSIGILQQMARDGEMTTDVLKTMVKLEEEMVPLDSVAAQLQTLVTTGKLTPAVAAKILDEYKQQKAEIGTTNTIDQLVRQAEAAAFQEISELLATGKISPDVAAKLTDMIQKNVSLDEYKAAVNQMVQQKQLTPEIAQLKIGDYTRVKTLRDEAARLANLQANNVTPEQYADELKRAVAAGLLTPDQAARLMQEYQAITARPAAVTAIATGAGADQFAALQQRVQQGAANNLPPGVSPEEFAAAQAQAAQETAQDRQARLEALLSAMSGQAQQLVAAWQPPTMSGKVGVAGEGAGKDGLGLNGKGGTGSSTTSTTTTTTTAGPTLVKAGTIIFAVLDTAVNSDYPDSPVMATVVAGDLKGAKLLGRLTTTKSVSGQLDRVTLNFTLMNLDAWPKAKNITAYAIDPDTARTVLASSVNYHYMMRFGAIMATSFLQGYASAITNEGTSTTGIFGTSTTHPNLSPANKIAVALGQMGQTLGTATQNYINIPPTVRVDSGVGLGILFMSDVT